MAGISHFWFEVIENGKKRLENQGGPGFPLQTDVVVSESTCLDISDQGVSRRVDIAVGFTFTGIS